LRKRNKNEQAAETGRAGKVAVAIAGHPREFAGIVMATVATFAIFTNALFLQKGPHPAPIFASRPLLKQEAVPLAPPRPQVQQQTVPPITASEASPQNRTQLISDIQRELGRRGFYDGAVDGIWGARTDAAARDFVQATGAKMNVEASDGLLRAIAGSTAKRAAPEPARTNDPIAELIAPSKRVLAIQRALADFGYGQIKPTGVHDAETRAAIEKFERDHRLPITGQISDRFVRELAGMTGRPLE
jgi:peptidoglycan hydrolase-like protein with peptidoglycan-binding domain